MIDCLDKQQARREPMFWAQNIGPDHAHHHNQQQQQQQQQQWLQTSQQHQTALSQNSQIVSQPKVQQQNLLIDVQVDETQTETVANEIQQQPNNDLIGYYFGSISRETAEWILINHGNQLDGAYLLRSSGPKDDFVLSLLVVRSIELTTLKTIGGQNGASYSSSPASNSAGANSNQLEVLHYKIVETEDSFVALHGQVGDEKFATIDELIERAQGVATKPKWPIQRQSLESQILPPTFWGLSVDQIRLAILIKAKQWGFPLSIFQQPTMLSNNGSQLEAQSGLLLDNSQGLDDQQQQQQSLVTTLNNETIRTLIYKSLHEFQPWFHGRIGRDEAERRLEEHVQRDGRFLVRERDNFSYAMCISHKRTIKHYRIDVLSTGELAIQDGRKFTSLMALVSHYTIMSDGLWCALTEPCPRPIQQQQQLQLQLQASQNLANTNKLQLKQNAAALYTAHQHNQQQQQQHIQSQNIYCVPPVAAATAAPVAKQSNQQILSSNSINSANSRQQTSAESSALIGPNQNGAVLSLRAPIKEWLHSINNKWSQMIASKTNQQHQSLNSFLFGPANPLNNHCRHKSHSQHNHHHHHHHQTHTHNNHRRRSKGNCSRQQQQSSQTLQHQHKSAAPNKPNNIAHHHRQHQLTITANGNCNCCPMGAAGVRSALNGHPASLTQQIPSRMPTAGGGSECNSLRSMPVDGLVLQYNNGLANGGTDQLVPSGLGQVGGGGVQRTPANMSANQQSKVLLSCLPQNSGFMLDSQSFVGSPLFAVKTTTTTTTSVQQSQQQPADATKQTATIDGLSGAVVGSIRRQSNGLNGRAASGSSGSGQSGNNVEKLISPAQSIGNDLNAAHQRLHQQPNSQQHDANPYALHSDIYGSQTSTAIVNDHLQTSSSSSSSNNAKQQQQQQSNRLLQNHFQNYHSHQQHPGASVTMQTGANLAPTRHGATELANRRTAPVGAANQTRLLPVQRNGSNAMANVQHAGPILCGQHAGPAYRYANCTGIQENSALRQCPHSAALGLNSSSLAHQSRAVDDLHLLQATNGTQLAGPAALTKFVQFQDGQCLRTHRDTKSIQMAYLLSRQEALNVLNNRNQTTRMTAQVQNQTLNQQIQSQRVGGTWQSTFASSQTPRPTEPAGANLHNNLNLSQSNEQTSGQIEYDLIDCDGSGFQFKYDPKLIKSSSIETLCGIGDDGDEDELHQDDHLAEFKSNSELLRTLAPFWSTSANNEQRGGQIPLVPMTANGLNGTVSSGANGQESCPLSSLMLLNGSDQDDDEGEEAQSRLTLNATEDQSHFEENWSRKHNLDELTTSLLAELTASLKAQVELKNKRSGLCAGLVQENQPNEQVANSKGGDQSNGGEQIPKSVVPNPLELVEEFDTLIKQTR